MTNKSLIVLESIHLRPAPEPEAEIITTGELGRWIRSGKVLLKLFRYKGVCLVTSQYHQLTRPFLLALTLKLLSRGKCLFKETRGTDRPITFITLFLLFFDFVRDLIQIPFILNRHHKTVKNLESINFKDNATPLELTHPPLFLRTDLFQGQVAGGSFTHTTGIVNNLHHFTSKPVVLTTVEIPGIEPHSAEEIEFDAHNRNFTDIFLLESNNRIPQQAKNTFDKFSFVYHRHSFYNYSGVMLAHQFRIPLVIEYNSPGVWAARNWSQGLQYENLANHIELLNFHAASVIVVVSQPLKHILEAREVETEKILVNPNGVDLEVYSPEIDGSNIRRKYNLEDKTVVGFIGTFGKWHGAEVLAKAYGLLLKNHPDYRDTTRLLMIGDGVTMPQVESETKKYNIKEQVILTGIVPQKEGPAHLAACDLLASPHVPNSDGTPFFGSPTKLFEYMAMGKGIIASDLDQIGEVLEHDQTAWMVEPGNAESLMHGLKTLIDKPETRRRLGETARLEAVSQYSWKEHTRKIIEKLKERCPCD